MVEPPTSFQKGEGLDRTSIFKGGLLGKKGGDLFQGSGCNFYIKNELKSEKYLMTKKKFINKNVFLCHN